MQKGISEYVCSNKSIIPRGYTLPFKLPDQVLLGVGALSLTLLFGLSFVNKKGFLFYHFMFIVELILAFIGFVTLGLFLTQTSIPLVCKTIKPTMGLFLRAFSDTEIMSQMNFFSVPPISQFFDAYPQYKIYLASFIQATAKLGINSPIFLIVLGLFLLNKKTKKFTLSTVIFALTTLVSIFASMDYFSKTQNLKVAVIASIAVVIIVVAVANSLIVSGSILLVPVILLHTTAIFIAACKFLLIDELLLFIPVYVISITYGLFWMRSDRIIASFFIYIGLGAIITLPTGSLVALMFLVNGYKA